MHIFFMLHTHWSREIWWCCVVALYSHHAPCSLSGGPLCICLSPPDAEQLCRGDVSWAPAVFSSAAKWMGREAARFCFFSHASLCGSQHVLCDVKAPHLAVLLIMPCAHKEAARLNINSVWIYDSNYTVCVCVWTDLMWEVPLQLVWTPNRKISSVQIRAVYTKHNNHSTLKIRETGLCGPCLTACAYFAGIWKLCRSWNGRNSVLPKHTQHKLFLPCDQSQNRNRFIFSKCRLSPRRKKN